MTIQGEGPFTGQTCVFVRLSRCNLHCTWCDTPYTWAHTPAKAELHKDKQQYDIAQEEHVLSVGEVADEALELLMGDLVVISGGEPMLQQVSLAHLCETLHDSGVRIQIETAGTIPPIGHMRSLDYVNYVVSPKPPSSNNDTRVARNSRALSEFVHRQNVWWKFVIGMQADLDYARELIDDFRIPESRVWLMPEGTTAEAVMDGARGLVEVVTSMGWNLSLRTHTLIWGTERAR